MDDCGGSRYQRLTATVRKKRSQMLRRPMTESLTFPEYLDHSPLTPLSDNVGRVSSDECIDDANAGGRIYNINYCLSRDSSANRFKGDYSSKKNKEDGGSSATYNNAHRGDDTYPSHGASLRKLGNDGDGVANDSKLKKIKLKVGGVTRTIKPETVLMDHLAVYCLLKVHKLLMPLSLSSISLLRTINVKTVLLTLEDRKSGLKEFHGKISQEALLVLARVIQGRCQ